MHAEERGRFSALLAEVRREIALVERQIQRSRAARGVAATSASLVDGTESSRPAASPSPANPNSCRDEEKHHGKAAAGDGNGVQMPSMKEGYLWHVGSAGAAAPAWHYFVVDATGVRWYESREAAQQQQQQQAGRKPLGRIGFSLTTTNSRGSVFRKAAVCWPLILPEDCPQVAKDPTKTYFAVDYYVPQAHSFGAGLFSGGGDGGVEGKKLILGTASPAERDAWVAFLRQYIDIYLAPRAESEELQYLVAPRHSLDGGREGSRGPLHRSEVIDGEAPGGNYL